MICIYTLKLHSVLLLSIFTQFGGGKLLPAIVGRVIITFFLKTAFQMAFDECIHGITDYYLGMPILHGL